MENNKQQNSTKKNKKHLFLNIAIGSLALAGSVGTIVFGTLWCQGRNTPISPEPTPSEPTIVNLDQFVEEADQQCSLSTTGLSLEKNKPIALVSKMEDIAGTIDKSTGLITHGIQIMDVSGSSDYPPAFYGNCEFYIDDTLISPDHYVFSTSAAEDQNFSLIVDPDFPLPVEIDYDNSVFKLVMTPYSEIRENITFYAYYAFDEA